MKGLFLTATAICLSMSTFCQPNDTSILIIPCTTGELVVDGVSKGRTEADDAHVERLSFGDHYIQLKTEQVKINRTIHLDRSLSSNIIRLGCETKNENVIRLLDKQMSIYGAARSEANNNYFGLDDGDKLNIQCSVLNKKGNATISIMQYETGIEIYKKEKFDVIAGDIVKIPKKGIYKILVYTDALFGKDVKLVVDRMPAATSTAEFKTTVHMERDTTSTEVLNTTLRVYSLTNLDHSNKSVLRLNLPRNTNYWVYWIGVGQESKAKMKEFVTELTKGAQLISLNPLVLFGMNLVPGLPSLNATSTISYSFTDAENAALFNNNYRYSYYTFRYGNNIASDYALINQVPWDLTLCLSNSSTMTGEDVDVKVVAFSVRTRLEMDDK